MPNKRDPRVDPKAGDELSVSGIYRLVEILDPVKHVWFDQIDFAGRHYCYVALAQWRKWAKNAEVIHAED